MMSKLFKRTSSNTKLQKQTKLHSYHKFIPQTHQQPKQKQKHQFTLVENAPNISNINIEFTHQKNIRMNVPDGLYQQNNQQNRKFQVVDKEPLPQLVYSKALFLYYQYFQAKNHLIYYYPKYSFTQKANKKIIKQPEELLKGYNICILPKYRNI